VDSQSFWEGAVIKGNAPWFFKLWGIPFVVVGLYIIIGRFFVDARIRRATAYGVTSDRVIMISGFPRRTVKSVSLLSLSEISFAEDGSGTITLGSDSQAATAPADETAIVEVNNSAV